MGKIGQHSSNFIDMTGWKMWEHGVPDSRVEVVKECDVKKHPKKVYWECKCICGNEFITDGVSLRCGNTLSCGCVKADRHPHTHGQSTTKLYGIWIAMRKRCNNSNDHDYYRYGARGISVCHEWDTYESFRDWSLSNGYTQGLEIDRIDNDGNYCPENCRWTTHQAQCCNRSTNVWIEYNGQKLSPRECSRLTGISEDTIRARVKNGWSAEEIISVPHRTKRKVYYNEKNQRL